MILSTRNAIEKERERLPLPILIFLHSLSLSLSLKIYAYSSVGLEIEKRRSNGDERLFYFDSDFCCLGGCLCK